MKMIHPNVTNTICDKYKNLLQDKPTWNCKSAKRYFESAVRSYLIENENKFYRQLQDVRDEFYLKVDSGTSWGKNQLATLLHDTLNHH